MAATLNSTLAASSTWNHIETTADGTTIPDSGKLSFSAPLANGTSASQADTVWHDKRSILTTANDDLDLTALVQSLFGASVAVAFAKVKSILIVNLSSTSGDKLHTDSSVTNGFTAGNSGSATSKVEIGAGSSLLLASVIDGWTVDSSHKVLRINNPGGNTIQYSIAITGTSV